MAVIRGCKGICGGVGSATPARSTLFPRVEARSHGHERAKDSAARSRHPFQRSGVRRFSSTMAAPYKPYSIAGQVALVTGASSGIGEACCWRLAAAGCKVVLVARRVERLDEVRRAIAAHYPVPMHCVALDVRDASAILALPEQLPADFRAVDILVNNAGLALGTAPVQGNDIADCATMLSTNVLSVLAMMRAFTPGMVARDRGHVINMSSIAGHSGYEGGSAYCATKAAVEAMTESARHDLMDTHVRVTAISPGAVKTNFSVVRYGGDAAAADAVYEGFVPLTADDIADNVLYAATRPEHVQVTQIVTLATAQAAGTKKSKKLRPRTAGADAEAKLA